MKHVILIYLVFISCISGGCGRCSSMMDRMDSIDSIMEPDPIAALSRLQEIEISELGSARENARHALLLSEANYKNYIDSDDDSLINVALRYYADFPDSEEYMKSLYFRASIALNTNNPGKSISLLLEAKEIARMREDYDWLARISEMMGDAFLKAHNDDESGECSLAAAEYYRLVGNERRHRFVMVDYAISKGNQGESDIALNILDSIYRLSVIPPADSMLSYYCMRSKFPILVNTKKYDEAKDLLGHLSERDLRRLMTARNRARYARIKLYYGDLKGCYSELKLADSLMRYSDNRAPVYSGWAEYYTCTGNFEKAKIYTDSNISFQNKYVRTLLKESVVSAQRDYYSSKADRESSKSRRITVILWISLTMAIIVTVVGFIIHRLGIKAKDAEIDSKVQNILLLSNQISEKDASYYALSKALESKDDEISELKAAMERRQMQSPEVVGDIDRIKSDMQREMSELFRNSWNILNILCNQFFEKGESEVMRQTILKDIELEIEKMKDCKYMQKIEDAVDKYMNGIVGKMKSECTFLKPDDITLLTLVLAGFSPRAICLIRDLKLKNFYMKKKRLLDRIAASNLPDKGAILSYFA